MLRLNKYTTIEEHGDHSNNDTWWLLIWELFPIFEPLSNDHPVHKTEESNQHNELGKSFKDKINNLSIPDIVWHPEAGTKKHLSDTIHDSCLHLETVKVNNFFITSHPCVIKSKWIHTFIINLFSDNSFVSVSKCFAYLLFWRHLPASFG